MDDVTIEQQIAAAKRELAMRRSVYPKLISFGRMKQDKADHEIAAMEAILKTLTDLKTWQDYHHKLYSDIFGDRQITR